MTHVIKANPESKTITVSHNPDGGITIYLPLGPVVISSEERVALAEYLAKESN